MITEAEYVKDRLANGTKGHYHDGIWWQMPFPFYAKPMFEFHALVPGASRPRPIKALCYSHQVPEARLANRMLPYMILEGQDLRSFDIQRLPGKKRNQVRKGLKSCKISLLQDVEPYLDEIRAVYISQSERHTQHYETPDTPPSFYTEHGSLWREREWKYLTSCGREVWGAFVGDSLVAFLVTSQVDHIRFIEKMKSRTEFMNLCPSDALYFSVLQVAAVDKECQKIINPGVRGGGLDRYKEQFLFKRTLVPLYVSKAGLFRLAETVSILVKKARTRRRGQGTAVSEAVA